MPCCCPHSRSASRLFSLFARSYRRRFERRGFEPSQRQLLEGLEMAGYRDASLLEVGSGVGHLHQHLLEQGAARATGIDLAPAMIDEARDWAKQRGLTERVTYLSGDFMALCDAIDSADVTILDKVVCCYPDADGLVHASLAKTQRVYALTIPRGRWFVRLGVGVLAGLMWLLRSDFRPYVHDPERIDAWITEAGFERVYEGTTAIWLSRVYRRVTG